MRHAIHASLSFASPFSLFLLLRLHLFLFFLFFSSLSLLVYYLVSCIICNVVRSPLSVQSASFILRVSRSAVTFSPACDNGGGGGPSNAGWPFDVDPPIILPSPPLVPTTYLSYSFRANLAAMLIRFYA